MWLSWQRIYLQCRRPGFDPSVGKIPWRRERLPTPVFWPGEFHGVYRPWACKELDTTERPLLTHFTRASLITQLVKNPPAIQETLIQFLGWEDHWRRDKLLTPVFLGFPCGSAGKKICLQCRRPGFDPWAVKIPWRREKVPTPVFWPGESLGLYRLWGCKELDRTERLSLSHSS